MTYYNFHHVVYHLLRGISVVDVPLLKEESDQIGPHLSFCSQSCGLEQPTLVWRAWSAATKWWIRKVR